MHSSIRLLQQLGTYLSGSDWGRSGSWHDASRLARSNPEPCTSGRPFGRSAIAASGSVAAVFKEASKRSPQAPGNPNINHD